MQFYVISDPTKCSYSYLKFHRRKSSKKLRRAKKWHSWAKLEKIKTDWASAIIFNLKCVSICMKLKVQLILLRKLPLFLM